MRLLCFLLLVSLFACHSNDRPKEVLTQAQLSALLVDVYLAEARTDLYPKLKDTTIKYFIPFEEKLLKSRGIPDSVLKMTYSYYLANPKELEQVYDSVIDTLVLREQRLNKIPYQPRKAANN